MLGFPQKIWSKTPKKAYENKLNLIKIKIKEGKRLIFTKCIIHFAVTTFLIKPKAQNFSKPL